MRPLEEEIVLAVVEVDGWCSAGVAVEVYDIWV